MKHGFAGHGNTTESSPNFTNENFGKLLHKICRVRLATPAMFAGLVVSRPEGGA